ncbi:hypothetical protein GGR51DRAFT_88927 [Nemania sp. FL0031]|nr:hypothetical protein GGR51DRAFT_88927 [Nemania sp. FL0031]
MGTSCNNRQRTFAPASFLYEMMIISFLNYQADEFMDACAGSVFQGRTDDLRQLIGRAFRQGPNSYQDLIYSNYSHIDRTSYAEVLCPLIKLVRYIPNHPYIIAASRWDCESMKRGLRTFLYAHVTQLEDNTRFQQQHQQQQRPGCATSYASRADSFFHWVRTTSADNTSCPYWFSFVGCLMSACLLNGQDCFPTVHEKYPAAVVCQHLATMCRMYNDYGSISRDASEGNLNSINFPKYQPIISTSTSTSDVGVGVGTQKRALFELEEYERACLNNSLRRLTKMARKRAMQF